MSPNGKTRQEIGLLKLPSAGQFRHEKSLIKSQVWGGSMSKGEEECEDGEAG